MVLIRLAKVSMIAALAVYALIVTCDNIVDYDSNFRFVAHVMSMDTTLPGNALMHRAITDKGAWSAAYAIIITIEGLTGVLLVISAMLPGRPPGNGGSAGAAAKKLRQFVIESSLAQSAISGYTR
jgi:predicted small integral membrane protein